MTVIGGNLQKRHGVIGSPIRLQIHCIMTTPTTWDASTIRAFSAIARNAIDRACQTPEARSFAPCLKSFQCNITEPDAAATFFLQSNTQLFAEDDTFLLLDLGGGTSDPCFVRVKKMSCHWLCWPLGPIRGIYRGCNDIKKLIRLDAESRFYSANQNQESDEDNGSLNSKDQVELFDDQLKSLVANVLSLFPGPPVSTFKSG